MPRGIFDIDVCFVMIFKELPYIFRHPNAQMYYSYKYRFQAPDSYNYDVSWSEFFNEKLENYNWNYLDQYICTRGEGDFGLMEVSQIIARGAT